MHAVDCIMVHKSHALRTVWSYFSWRASFGLMIRCLTQARSWWINSSTILYMKQHYNEDWRCLLLLVPNDNKIKRTENFGTAEWLNCSFIKLITFLHVSFSVETLMHGFDTLMKLVNGLPNPKRLGWVSVAIPSNDHWSE